MKPAMSMIQSYLQATLLALSIWVVAILINTVFVTGWMSFSRAGDFGFDMAGFIIYFSAVFSSPGFFILWLTVVRKFRNKELFQILLLAALTGSLLASVTLAFLLRGAWEDGVIVLVISPVVNALLSVLLHKPLINKISEKYNEEPCIESL